MGKLVDGDGMTSYMGTGFHYWAEVTLNKPYTVASVRVQDCESFDMAGNVRIQVWNGTATWTTIYEGPYTGHAHFALGPRNNITKRHMRQSVPNVRAVRIDGQAMDGIYCMSEIEVQGVDPAAATSWATHKASFDCPSKSRESSCDKLKEEFESLPTAIRAKVLTSATSFKALTGDELRLIGKEVLSSLRTLAHMDSEQLKNISSHVRTMSVGQFSRFVRLLDGDVLSSSLDHLGNAQFSEWQSRLILNKLNSSATGFYGNWDSQAVLDAIGVFIRGLEDSELLTITDSALTQTASVKYLTGKQLRVFASRMAKMTNAMLGSFLESVDPEAFKDALSTLTAMSGWSSEHMQSLMIQSQKPSVYGNPSEWDGTAVQRFGSLIAGLSNSAISLLSPDSCTGLQADAVEEMDSASVDAFSNAQLLLIPLVTSHRFNHKKLASLSMTKINTVVCSNVWVNATGFACPEMVVDAKVDVDKELSTEEQDAMAQQWYDDVGKDAGIPRENFKILSVARKKVSPLSRMLGADSSMYEVTVRANAPTKASGEFFASIAVQAKLDVIAIGLENNDAGDEPSGKLRLDFVIGGCIAAVTAVGLIIAMVYKVQSENLNGTGNESRIQLNPMSSPLEERTSELELIPSEKKKSIK
jgi:hypothetical protein